MVRLIGCGFCAETLNYTVDAGMADAAFLYTPLEAAAHVDKHQQHLPVTPNYTINRNDNTIT